MKKNAQITYRSGNLSVDELVSTYTSLDPDAESDLIKAQGKSKISNFVKNARKHAGINQAELADKVGLKQSRISQIENMKPDTMSMDIELLMQIAHVCGVKLKIEAVFP